jgi:hypothetical protein
VIDPTGIRRFTLVALWASRPGAKHGRQSYAGRVAVAVDVWKGGLAAVIVELISSAYGNQR